MVEPRLVLRHAAACAPPPIAVLGEPDDYLRAALDANSSAPSRRPTQSGAVAPAGRAVRTILDRRGESPLAVLADARAADDGGVLAVCAEVSRGGSPGLAARTGGFALISHESLAATARSCSITTTHIVVLDPPASAAADAAIRQRARVHPSGVGRR